MSNDNFYIIKLMSGTKQTGNVYPQCVEMSKNYPHYAQDSYQKLVHYRLPDFEPNLKAFKLHRKAKQTDVISSTFLYFGLLVSKRAKEIFENFLLPENKFFPAWIEFKNSISNGFSFFHYVGNYSSAIDYAKTEFYVSDYFGYKERIVVNNENELDDYLENNRIGYDKHLSTTKYIFEKNEKPTLDFFKMSYTDSNIYISHRLKTALEEANITGIEIVPTDVI